MRIATLSSLFLIPVLFLLLFAPPLASAAMPAEEAVRMLPDRVGDFRAHGAALEPQEVHPEYLVQGDGVLSAASREYVSAKGEKLSVLLIRTRSDSSAYALLTSLTKIESKHAAPIQFGDLGTASLAQEQISFFKGSTFVRISSLAGPRANYDVQESLARSLGRSLAETLDKGEGEVPVLVKHLPDWERERGLAVYAVSPVGLQRAVGNRPVLDAVSFEGGAEAVTSGYGPSQLAIIEYTTPQLAADADARIQERIKQLQSTGGPVPTAYRRVGNYSVFVFDAPDEMAASQLIEQVSYEQVVQWLGDDPRILQRVQREYVNTMGGTILAVLKASGLSLIVCLGVGGLAGGLVFIRRRAQAAAIDAYSDAGGMLRLNIDEMNAQSDSARLLGRGEG